MNLAQIALGWFHFISGSPDIKQMMGYRLRICDTCPKKKQLNEAGKLVVRAVNEKASIYYCGACGCPLAAKVANPKARCPLKVPLWKKHTPNETYY